MGQEENGTAARMGGLTGSGRHGTALHAPVSSPEGAFERMDPDKCHLSGTHTPSPRGAPLRVFSPNGRPGEGRTRVRTGTFSTSGRTRERRFSSAPAAAGGTTRPKP